MKGMNYFILTSCCLLLAACASTDEPQSAAAPVGFSTSVDEAQTRYATDDLPETMGVFACLTESGSCTSANFTPNFMHRQKVIRSGTDWNYTPVKYWPTASGNKLSFLAYAPYVDKIEEDGNDLTYLSSAVTAGYPSIVFTNSTGKTDLLLAAPLLNQEYGSSGSGVSLPFKHALAQVSFYVQNGDATAGKKFHSLSVLAPRDGKYTLAGQGSYEVYSEGATVRHEFLSAATDIPANTTDKTLLGSLHVHPDATRTKFSMTYSINGNAANTVTFTDVALPSTPSLAGGANIAYTITVNEYTYTITALNSIEWAQGSDKDIAYYSPDDLKLGDYYYTDGTTSDGGVRRTINGVIDLDYTPVAPIADTDTKKCLGIVFYIGKHPSDETSYVDKNGDEMTDIHGYVMALRATNNNSRINWYKSNDLLMDIPYSSTDFNGYRNTYIIKKYAEDNSRNFSDWPAAYQCVMNHDAVAPSPMNSSGWFLPSHGQITSFRTSSIIVNNLEKAKTVIAATLVFSSDSWYWNWSSNQTPGRAETAVVVQHDGSRYDYFKKDTGVAYARPVLVF